MSTEKKYAVYRNNYRVSELEYASPKEAEEEYGKWENIIKKWPDGSKLTIKEIKEN
jgi:predicted GIY-YIG superfamily endonuclease